MDSNASGLKIGQINLHKSFGSTLSLKRYLDDEKIDLTLAQEPNFHSENLGFDVQNGRLFKPPDCPDPRVCIFAAKECNLISLSDFCCRDLMTVLVKYKKGDESRNILVCSAYFPYEALDLTPLGVLERVFSYGLQNNIPVLVGCDANAHHMMWGSSDTNSRGERLLEFIFSKDGVVLNKGNTPTFFNAIRQEVIDITFCTCDVSVDVLNWTVHKDISISDHRLISYTIFGDQNSMILFRNPKVTNFDVFSG